jgi:hypothetical protein
MTTNYTKMVIYVIPTYTKCFKNIPNGNKMHIPFLGPPKYTQIGIFGMKIYHLATLFYIPTTNSAAHVCRMDAPVGPRSVQEYF